MKKNIDIQEPCSENWDNMKPTERGAFCKSCAIDVYDFTKKSGDEIRDILKLSIGSSVCGKIKPSQLNALNADFNSWQMNSKRSFQSALVFSLIVAFGMTLFSCEEEEEQQKIGSIQQVGMSFIADQDESVFKVGVSADQAIADNEILEIPEMAIPIVIEEYPEEFEYEVVGIMEEPRVAEEPEVTLPVEIHIAGGIGYSGSYERYLEVDDITDHKIEDVKIEFEAIAFPNPAKEQTTLRVMLPKKMKVQVQLFNLSGQLIETISKKRLSKGENNLPISLLDLPNGIYIISIRSDEFNESVQVVKL